MTWCEKYRFIKKATNDLSLTKYAHEVKTKAKELLECENFLSTIAEHNFYYGVTIELLQNICCWADCLLLQKPTICSTVNKLYNQQFTNTCDIDINIQII